MTTCPNIQDCRGQHSKLIAQTARLETSYDFLTEKITSIEKSIHAQNNTLNEFTQAFRELRLPERVAALEKHQALINKYSLSILITSLVSLFFVMHDSPDIMSKVIVFVTAIFKLV